MTRQNLVKPLATAILVLGIATARHAHAVNPSPFTPQDPPTSTCYGYVRNIDEKIGGVGTECLFERKTLVGKIILKACGPGNYCRVVTENTPEGIAGNKNLHPITVIFGIDTLFEDGKNPDPSLTKKRNCNGVPEIVSKDDSVYPHQYWYKVDDCLYPSLTPIDEQILDTCKDDVPCKLVVYGNYTDKKDCYITKIISVRALRKPQSNKYE